MQVKKAVYASKIITVFLLPLFLLVILSALVGQTGEPALAQGFFGETNNLVRNGNFESGFYPVYELGFEAPDVGQVPNEWNWFKNDAYGKYSIYNNEGFGLICSDDVFRTTIGKNSLSIHMQSTDQMDARLGVYQTIDVVKGKAYRFSISGTIQSMQGSPEASDRSHVVEIVFDHSGGDDWTAIPHEQWTQLPWSEYELEFNTSGPNDPDIAKIEEYETIITPGSNKLTIFIAAWRRWADWRSVRYTLDCVSLVPVDGSPAGPAQPVVAPADTTATSGVQPAAAEVDPQESTPAEAPPIIPDSGGVLDNRDHAGWMTGLAVVVIVALLAAGLWSFWRTRIG